MILLSWNVNGIRAALRKGAGTSLRELDADVICLQEIKAQEDQVDLDLAGYSAYWNSAERKGYAGTLVLARREPLRAWNGIGVGTHSGEGRVVTLEYPDLHVVNVYTPNSRRGLTRLAYRQRWDKAFTSYLRKLDREKPVVCGGDFNVAHREIDLANPRSNRRNAGFTDEERAGFDRLLAAGFLDSFREFCDEGGHYTWWANFARARERNVGWRVDYFLVSRALRPRLAAAEIHPEVMGSDHCPVTVRID